MRIIYNLSMDLNLIFELDDDGKIVPDVHETERDAIDLAESLCELRGQKLDDFISGVKDVPYGVRLSQIDLDIENSEWEPIQFNWYNPSV